LGNHTLLIAPDGTESPIADSGAPIRDENGAVIGVVLVFRDQTEERAAQNALRESEEHYRSLFDNMLNGFAYCKMLFDQNQPQDFIYLNVNSSFEILTGLKNVVGKKVSEVIPGLRESDPELFETYARVALTGKPERLETYVEALKMWFSISVYSPEKEYFVSVFDVITERKRAEEALRANEEKYRLVGDYNYNWEYWIGPSGALIYNSPSCQRITGFAPEEFIADYRLIEAIVHPEDQDKLVAHNQEIMQEPQELCELEFRIITKGGEDRWLSHVCQPVYGDQNIWMGRRASNQDITERKRAEEALKDSEERFRTMGNAIPQLAWIAKSDGYIFWYNQRWYDYTGTTPEEMEGWGWQKVHDPEVLPQVLEQWRASIATGTPLDMVFPLRGGDGQFRQFLTRVMPMKDVQGQVIQWFGTNTDITERKRAEEELRENEEKFRVVFEQAPIGIMIYNQTGIIYESNEKFEEIIGAPKEKFLGFNLIRQLRDKQMREAVAASLRGEVGYYEGNYRSVTSGKSTNIRAIYQPIFSPEGVVSSGVTIFEDITELKKAEVERLRFSKLESLATLAGGIAHDFNNILTAILGNVSLAMLEKNKGLSQKILTDAERACLRAQGLAQQLLTFAKGGAPIKELVSMSNLATEAGSFACTGSRVKCEFSLPNDLWMVAADPGQIGQVFQNLVINAIQAMPTGGAIQVRGENLVMPKGSALPLDPGRYVMISIQDQGLGIPAGFLPRIFDPYFTTKQRGSGLGLATAYSIIQAHRGHIAVESNLGTGTIFQVYLPTAEQTVIKQPKVDAEVITGEGKILVMDDEEMVLQTLNKMLTHLGYEVCLAKDGSEAIELFTQAQESDQGFDVVILDLTVPGGMGGKEALKNLLKLDPQVKAIVSSGYSEDQVMAEFAQYGFSSVIAKPYRISDLSKVLNRVLTGNGGSS
jgi:PAS domain S-box-containing protein